MYLPPLPEQRAIAHILGSLDEKIELNRRMNETLEATARALFKSWFVDFDPVHYKVRGEQPSGMDAQAAALFPDSFEESELGLNSGGVGDLSLRRNCPSERWQTTAKKSKIGESVTEHPYLKVKDFTEMGLDRSDIKYIDEETYQTVRRYIVTSDDIYISIAGTIGRVGIVPPDLSGANLTEKTQRRFAIIPPVVNKYYLLHFLQTPEGQNQIASKVVGTSQPKLALFRIAELSMIIPSLDLMQVATKFFETNASLIDNLQMQNSNLNQTRDALLPKLVSGALRVGEVDLNADIGLL